MKKIAIIGAGLTGLMLSLYLARRSYQIDIYEKRPDPRLKTLHESGGRAISVDLSARALLALTDLGLSKKILSCTVPMRNRIMHLANGELLSLAYGKNQGDCIYTVSRAQLYSDLLDAVANTAAITLHFDQKFINTDLVSGETIMQDQITQAEYTLSPFFIVGCDGAFSAIRKYIETTSKIRFNQIKFPWHYKQLTIAENKAATLEYEAMHMWPRQYSMLAVQPNHDHSFTGALLLPAEGEHSFESLLLKDEKTLKTWFELQFPDAHHLFANWQNEMRGNATSTLTTINGGTWTLGNKLILMGDSAHAMVPFFGQGLNCCFEDCYLFDKCLDAHQDNWETAIPAFEASRKADTDAITIMSYENYPELLESDLQYALLQRQIENYLMHHFSDSYTTYHNLTCFSLTPYQSINKIRLIQKEMITKIASDIDHISEINQALVSAMMQAYQGKLRALTG